MQLWAVYCCFVPSQLHCVLCKASVSTLLFCVNGLGNIDRNWIWAFERPGQKGPVLFDCSSCTLFWINFAHSVMCVISVCCRYRPLCAYAGFTKMRASWTIIGMDAISEHLWNKLACNHAAGRALYCNVAQRQVKHVKWKNFLEAGHCVMPLM